MRSAASAEAATPRAHYIHTAHFVRTEQCIAVRTSSTGQRRGRCHATPRRQVTAEATLQREPNRFWPTYGGECRSSLAG
jgi:hypothetical protein